MDSSYEENLKKLEDLRNQESKAKELFEKLDKEVTNIEQNYPDISIDKLISSNVDVNEYLEKRSKYRELEKNRNIIRQEYIYLQDDVRDFEKIVNKQLEEKKMKVINEIENSKERKQEKEIKRVESESKKEQFIEKYNAIMNKPGLLKAKEVTELVIIASNIHSYNFLTIEEKNDIKQKIDSRISENNKLVDTPNVKIKEPKVKQKKKFTLKSKKNSIVAKGKDETIGTMKDLYKKSIGKLVGGIKGIYNKFCNIITKDIQEKLDEALNTIDNLNEKIDQMKSHIERQEDLNEAFDDVKNNGVHYSDQEILDFMSEAQIKDIDYNNQKNSQLNHEMVKYFHTDMNKAKEVIPVLKGDVLSADSEEVKRAIDIDKAKSIKAELEHKLEEQKIQNAMYISNSQNMRM